MYRIYKMNKYALSKMQNNITTKEKEQIFLSNATGSTL